MTEHRMVRLAFYSLVVVLGLSLGAARSVEASEIGLTSGDGLTPASLSGSSALGQVFDLTVSFDPNRSYVTNLVSQELYVDFFGLTPVADSYQLGSVYTPFKDLPFLDGGLLLGNGLCGDVGCSSDSNLSAGPLAPLNSRYTSQVAVGWPSMPGLPGVPGVPDTLFSLQFTVSANTLWGLNVIGDDTFSLYWDATVCKPSDAPCFSDPQLFPFVIVSPLADVDSGTARVNVSLREVPAEPVTPVPEPSSLVLAATGLIGIARSLRRRAGLGRRSNARG